MFSELSGHSDYFNFLSAVLKVLIVTDCVFLSSSLKPQILEVLKHPQPHPGTPSNNSYVIQKDRLLYLNILVEKTSADCLPN